MFWNSDPDPLCKNYFQLSEVYLHFEDAVFPIQLTSHQHFGIFVLPTSALEFHDGKDKLN
jgi:hypothetical protein